MFSHTPITRYRIVIFPIVIISTLLCAVQPYNLNVKRAKVISHPHKYKRDRPNYFGFTVALYNSPKFTDQSVLVGAPRANTTQTLVNEPGTVYKCSLNSKCTEWNLDNTFATTYGGGTIERDNSWLGASISVEDAENPKIMVCAPRWRIKWTNTHYMNGICYYTQTNASQSFDETLVERIMPFTRRNQQTATDSNDVTYYKYGMGLLGFSLNTFSNKKQWYGLLGAPNAHNSHGEPILLYRNDSIINSFSTGDYDTKREYLGYSVTSGKYYNRDEIQYAIGAPRSTGMIGGVRVYIDDPFRKHRTTMDVLNGNQIGEYFGASMTSCDVDNDGRDEIIVGAPMWTNEGDEGKIYIFTTRNTKNFGVPLEINGNVQDSRFGSSVMCLGDLDRDGYQDVAIGAPYENGHGTIYIYNGNQNGLSAIWSQRISADDFHHDLRGFGISISQPRDIDGNGYFDLAVGAHQSGHVVVLRSQPVVTVTLNIFSIHTRLDNKEKSFPIRVCGTYRGIRAPNFLKAIIRLKVDEAHQRTFITNLRRDNRTYSLPTILALRGSSCQNLTVQFKERNPNVIDPIEISASLILDPTLETSSKEEDFYTNSPVINKNMSKDEDNITLHFATNCGTDDICDSNIKLNMTTNLGDENRFVTGSTDPIKLFVNIENYGEPAYQTLAHIAIPESMMLLNNPVDCTHNGISKIHEVTCPIGNPLVFMANFTLELVLKQERNNKSHVEILAFVTTNSNNLNHDESGKNLTIHFVDDVDITVSGNALETSYFTFDNEKGQMLETINFQHIYRVRKLGVTPILQSQLTVSIPTHILGPTKKDTIEIAQINRTDISLHEVTNRRNPNCVQEYDNTGYKSLKYLKVDDNPHDYTLNCTNPMIVCTTISCFLETSSNSLIIGDVTITITLKLKNFTDQMSNKTGTIFFISDGHVKITSPSDMIQRSYNEPDDIQVRTTFDGSTAMSSRRIPIWIIALSVFLGILLLALLTFGLIKLGFFHRKKKEELETLKSDETVNHTIILETTSSTEMLDCA